jgi:hypothetical protein
MTNTQQKILEVFKEFKTSLNGVLKPQSLDSRIRNWDRRSQDEAANAVEQLIKEEYISTNDNWYVLLEKGYNHLFSDYKLEDTENIILDVFKKHKIGVGQMLMTNSFISTQNSAERFHFDNFNNAINSLIQKHLIESTERGYILTQSGYEKIY